MIQMKLELGVIDPFSSWGGGEGEVTVGLISLSGSEFTNPPLLFFIDSFSFLLSFFFFFLGSFI